MIAALAMVTAGAIALPHVAIAAPLAQGERISDTKGGVRIEPAASYWWKNKNRHYDRRWHGKRYRNKHSGYRHYHNGWYYNSPWWLAAPLVGGALLGAYGAPRYNDGNAHVEWCLNRYRSYNPRTDRFLGYDGEYHRCNSPF